MDAGSDPRQFARQIVDYLRSLLLVKTGAPEQIDAASEVRHQMSRQAQSIKSDELLQAIRLFNEAANESRSSWQPALPLEMAFVAALEIQNNEKIPPVSLEPKQPAGPVIPRKSSSSPAQDASPKSASPPAPILPADQAGAALEPGSETGASLTDETFHQVQEKWRQVLSAVRTYNPTTQGLLNSCKPVGMKDGVLYLGFTSDFIKRKMESGSNIEYTCKALAQVLGIEIPVRCFVATGNSGSLPTDVESDGMVAAALRDLGGEIVDVQ